MAKKEGDHVIIDEETCTGCGTCMDDTKGCWEHKISVVNGKAKVIEHCDGFARCINCPNDAITFVSPEEFAAMA